MMFCSCVKCESALCGQVMHQGAIGDLVARRDGGRRGVGILDVPVAIEFLQGQTETTKAGIGKQGGMNGHLQPIGDAFRRRK